MTPSESSIVDVVKYFGEVVGYGNLIFHLREAWSEHLRKQYGFSPLEAARGAGHICPWCDVDSRTGKTVGLVEEQIEAILRLSDRLGDRAAEDSKHESELSDETRARFRLSIELAKVAGDMLRKIQP